MKKADNFNPGKWLVENKLTNQSQLNEMPKIINPTLGKIIVSELDDDDEIFFCQTEKGIEILKKILDNYNKTHPNNSRWGYYADVNTKQDADSLISDPLYDNFVNEGQKLSKELSKLNIRNEDNYEHPYFNPKYNFLNDDDDDNVDGFATSIFCGPLINYSDIGFSDIKEQLTSLFSDIVFLSERNNYKNYNNIFNSIANNVS